MARYPLLIGSIPKRHVGRTDHKFIIEGRAASDCPFLGSVDVDSMSEGDPLLPRIAAICSQHGFALNERHPGPYSVRDYTFGAGSVGPHTDSGMGLTIGALVAVAPLSPGLQEWMPKSSCHIMTKGASAEVELGDVFVFNADREHSWIANCRWVLAIHSVRKMRTRK